MSEPEVMECAPELIEALAEKGEHLARMIQLDNTEVLVVAPAKVIRIANGIVHVATSVALDNVRPV